MKPARAQEAEIIDVRLECRGLRQPQWAEHRVRLVTKQLERSFRDLTSVDWQLRAQGNDVSADCQVCAGGDVFVASAHALGVHDAIQLVLRRLEKQRRRRTDIP